MEAFLPGAAGSWCVPAIGETSRDIRSEWESDHERWLREAVFRLEGVDGLERLAQTSGHRRASRGVRRWWVRRWAGALHACVPARCSWASRIGVVNWMARRWRATTEAVRCCRAVGGGMERSYTDGYCDCWPPSQLIFGRRRERCIALPQNGRTATWPPSSSGLRYQRRSRPAVLS